MCELLFVFVLLLDCLNAGAYAKPGERFNFWELQARALQHGELVIAHKCAVNGNDWVLNPPKKAQILSWSAGDEVLVLTRPSKRL